MVPLQRLRFQYFGVVRKNKQPLTRLSLGNACRRGKMVREQVGVEARMGSTREGH